MAVVKVPQSSNLKIKVQTGVSGTGNPVYKTLSFYGLKSTAADADVFAVGTGLSSLQKNTLIDIIRVDTNNLISE